MESINWALSHFRVCRYLRAFRPSILPNTSYLADIGVQLRVDGRASFARRTKVGFRHLPPADGGKVREVPRRRELAEEGAGEMGLLGQQCNRGSRCRRWAALLIAIAVTLTVAVAAPASATSGVVAWGVNYDGPLGNGTTTASNVPVVVTGLTEVAAVSEGNENSLALMNDSTVMSWGWDAFGQLGDGIEGGPETCGTGPCSRTPVAVSGLSGVTAISTGLDHDLALLSNRTVMAWGFNRYGQLGDGSTEGSDVPVAVSGLKGVTAISASNEQSLALLSDGTVMEWGGVKGPDTCFNGASCSKTPEAVGKLKNVTAISAGDVFSLALLSNGTVMAWGQNFDGQLGNGTTIGSEVPVPVSELSGVTAISAGYGHSLALLSDGAVMAWGYGGGGQLGNGATMNSDVPVAVSGLSQATAISAGGSSSLALLSSGTIMSWGGTLGNGSGIHDSSDVPVAVSGLTEATAVAAGGDVDLAISPPPILTTLTKLSPHKGSASGGTTVKITGTNFTGATAVNFGSTGAASFTVHSATSITAISPPEAAGKVNVTVTTVHGTSAISSADLFNFVPMVAGLSPNNGSKAGGTIVTVTGAGFAVGTTATVFKFGTTKAISVNCKSTTECTATSPAHAAGKVDVTATVNKETSAKNAPADQFTYN